MAQTYVPTATCSFHSNNFHHFRIEWTLPGVLFSWISVWLPEEFIEGRIFVALTVFLTLSAESNAAKEILPRVSYVKAIDVWFGFTAIFIFSTMLQALAVISLEHLSRKMVGWLNCPLNKGKKILFRNELWKKRTTLSVSSKLPDYWQGTLDLEMPESGDFRLIANAITTWEDRWMISSKSCTQ